MAKPKMLVSYRDHFIEVDEDKITTGLIGHRGGKLAYVVAHISDEGLSIDEEWLSREEATDRHYREWHEFRLQIRLPCMLWPTAPPEFIDTDEKRWEWLGLIARNRIKEYGFGGVRRARLKAFLAASGKL